MIFQSYIQAINTTEGVKMYFVKAKKKANHCLPNLKNPFKIAVHFG
jgi:hypothetical protein